MRGNKHGGRSSAMPNERPQIRAETHNFRKMNCYPILALWGWIFGAEFSLGLRMKLLLAVLALINAGPAAADCPKAAAWARAFYSEHYLFYAGAPDPILQFTTPEFGALLKKEWAYSKGEVGHMDYDPWLGAQEGEIGKPVRFSVESESPDTAVVAMSYPFVLDPKRPSERHTADSVLRKQE